MEKKAEYHIIEPKTVVEMIENKESFYLVDVREKDEYDWGHIESSINISLSAIIQRAESSFDNKDSKIVVYCRSGARSRQACKELIYLGYTDVYDLGGIISYPYPIIR